MYTHYMWWWDAFALQAVVILLLSVCLGLVLGWTPRMEVLRLRRRVHALEEFYTSDRNKKASRARWDAKPEDDPLVRQMLDKKKETFDNEFTTGRDW